MWTRFADISAGAQRVANRARAGNLGKLAPGVLSEIAIEGWGLHSGAHARVVLAKRAGPVALRAAGVEATVAELSLASTLRATTVEAHGGTLRVGTVEHLFAALAGLGIHEGLAIEVEGPELPLLDGGAARWVEMITALDLIRSRSPTRITREEIVEVGSSRYQFSPAPTESVEVLLDMDDTRLAATARWDGDPVDFRDRVAPARTFVLERDLQELVRDGLARHADPSSVVVIAHDAIRHAGRPFFADEPARHKLLDLMGDLYLHGGPPVGLVRAFRPGHTATMGALVRVRTTGVIVAR
jgi:UDP-3-O-[3-hydroxymyristoyl] N-acetylglucosamine deacetylase